MKESVSCRYLAAEQSILNTHFLIKESIYKKKSSLKLIFTNKGKIEIIHYQCAFSYFCINLV